MNQRLITKKALLLALVLLLAGAILAGCANNDEPAQVDPGTPPAATNGGGNDTTADADVPVGLTLGQGEFPLTTEPVTLRIWGAEMVGNDMDTNMATTYFQEKTGVNIQWDLFSSAMSANEAFNILIASGDLPDIFTSSHPTERVMMMIEGDLLLRLNDFIFSEQGSYYYDALNLYPQLRNMVTAPCGGIFTFFLTDSGVHLMSENKMWVYTAWLDQLGMDPPRTPEEFREMIVAFMSNDMNGTGLYDALPLVGFHAGRSNDPINFLMNPFELFRTNYYVITDDGQIRFLANTDGWRDGLRFIHSLFAEGLIMEETYVQDQTQFQALLNRPPGETIVGVFPSWFQGHLIDLSVLNWTDYQAIPPLMGPTGLQQSAAREGGRVLLNGLIYANTEHPEIAFRFMDWMLSEEGNRFGQFGVEGQSFEWVDAPSFYHTTPSISMMYEFRITDMWNHGTMPRLDSPRVRYSTTYDPELRNVDNTWILFSAHEIYEPFYVFHNVPDIVWSDPETVTRVNDFRTMFNEYIDMMNTAFVVGTMDINDDAVWNNHVQQLESMGLQNYLDTLATFYGLN